MPKKFKNFFSFFAEKKPLLLVFFFIILGIFYPLKPVLAGWVQDLALNIATWPIFQIARILIDLAIWIAKLCGSLLNWVLSPNFIRFSYTNPAGPNGNPIIATGLSVTRGFVNMLLVLVLVYIAIATILRLAGYKTKRLLVTFIIVALLVNFAPVICGLIVDASNIVMNFFVQDLKGDAFSKAMAVRVEQIMAGYEATSTYTKARPFMMQIIIMVPFLFVLSFILLTFTLIFILRHLVIWVLVILSPLAFVCYILPATEKYWKMWWQQFLAWSFIGVTCGFFLYLGLLMVTYVPTFIGVPTTEGGGLFDSVLPFFVSVVFLGLGVVFGLKTSAMGAGSVIGFAKTKGKMVVRKAPGVAYKGARIAAGGIARGTARTAGKIREKALGPEGQKQWREEGEKDLAIAAKKSRLNPMRYYHRAKGVLKGGRLAETQQAKIKKIEESKDIKGMERTPELLEAYNNAMTDTRRIAILNKAIEKGKIGDLMDEKYGAGAIKETEMDRILEKARAWDADSTIKKAVPHLAAKYVTPEELKKAKEKDERIDTKEKFIMSKMKPADYKNTSEGMLDINNQDPEKAKAATAAVDAMLAIAMGSHISQFIEQHGRAGVNVIKERINTQRGGEQGTRDIIINESLEKYIRSGTGQAIIGIELPSIPTHFKPDEKDNKGNVIKRGKPFKSGYLRQGNKLVYIDSEAKMREAEIRATPKTPSPGGDQPITVKTIKEEIKESKKEGLPTIGEEIRKQRGKK